MESYLAIILAIAFSAFFSGMEIAFVGSSKLRLELDIKQNVLGAGILKFFTANPGQYIATMLIGNNISLVIYGLVISDILAPVLVRITGSEALVLIIKTLISTLIILVLAEFLPKALFRLSPNFFLRLFTIPSLIFYILFYPVSKLALFISNLIMVLLPGGQRIRDNEENLVFSRADLDSLVSGNNLENIQDDAERESIKLFQNALGFSNTRVRECMIPRTEIEAVEINSSISKLRERFIETRYSRILIYSDTIDQVAGYFELKDIFRDLPDIKSGMRKIAIVPETMPANKLLKQFVEEKMNVAVVVDEFGGTSGMVTIEDMLEEIVGDIQDEHDTEELIDKQVGPGEYVFSGRLEIDFINEKYGLDLPESDEYETLAGLVMFYHGDMPKTNQIIRIKNFIVRILRSTDVRVDLVSLKSEQ
ncbi:MAG: HlyC/CorC family transporter [Bacteroidales bacterium]|nr:HlyC/CorC family transporter [Bacteroidales bacterium]